MIWVKERFVMPVKFTIITPSFNQGRYLRKTLDSVAAQTFEDYEHLIFDPGSTDESLAIAESYCLRSPKARLVKGRDKSQTNAINLGFEESCGSILCWLNSDDQLYDAEVLITVNRIFDEEPDVDIVYGRGDFIAPDGKKLREAYINRDAARLRNAFANSLGILQPSLYLRKSAFLRAGQFDEKMNYSFDYEYWARCAALGFRFRFLDRMLSKAIIHDDAKTMRARGTSLLETAKAAKRYYDFLSIDWVKRIVDEENNGNDGIIASSTSLSETDVQARFYAENRSELAMARYFNDAPAMNESTREMFAKTVVAGIDRAYLSSWDKNYFDMGITLIASIHRHDPDAVTFVCDIGMSLEQLSFVAQLRNVVMLSSDFPPYSADWQRNPKNYVFKNILFEKVSRNLAQGTLLLWIDAGVALCEHPALIFKLIEEQGYFFINHDDSSHWPLFNASFTSDDAMSAAGFTFPEMAAPHVCSCLFGNKVGGPAQPMFELAATLAHNYLIAVGDKHPPESAKIRGLAKDQQVFHAAEFLSRNDDVANSATLRPIFGYYGHRQDQSIISALAARFKVRIASAKTFCPANDMSSVVSKENWFEGISKNVGDFRRDDYSNGGVTFHHRGLVKDFTGLRFAFERKNILAVIGNGPSLSGVDFTLFEPADCIGMNAAYRFWQKIGWYPAIYCCLDTIVGLSHKEAIADLVRNRRRLGIKQFLLRRNLVEWLEIQGVRDGVVCFDLIRSGFELLHPEPVTTGSHSLAWGAVLGYEKFLVAGVDCNYVEKVDGAVKDSNNILEIATEDPQTNVNYFFDSYQQVGDKFNIPNPSKDLHIRSWRNVASRLDTRHIVVNVSEVSRMDAFPKQHLDSALERFTQQGKFSPALLPAHAIVSAVSVMHTKPVAMAPTQSGVQSFKVEPGSHFTLLSANQWRYTHSDAPQKLWLAVFDGMGSTAGRSFVAGIRLKSSRAMTVDVSIGRYGNTDYEGARIRITLAPGAAQSVQVRKEFAKPHTALKVQVDVLELEGGGTADLTIDSIYLNETLASILRRVAERDLNLRVANRLFREGDYSTAMGLYLLLHQQRSQKMYTDNALMAAHKLGMDSVRTVDDLLQRVS